MGLYLEPAPLAIFGAGFFSIQIQKKMKNKFPDLRAKKRSKLEHLPGETAMRIHITAIFPEIHSELRDLYERLDIGYTKEDATKDVPPELKEEWDRMIDRAGRLEKLIAVLARQGQQITSETELEIEDDAGNPIIMQISRQRFKAQKWGYTWRLYLLSR